MFAVDRHQHFRGLCCFHLQGTYSYPRLL